MNFLDICTKPNDFDPDTYAAPAWCLHASLEDSHDELVGRFNYEFIMIAGLASLHLLWGRSDRDQPLSASGGSH